MTARRIVLRQRATQDVDDAIYFYVGEGGAELSLQFIDAIESALNHLATHAESGSPRYSTELDLPGLRHWPLRKFPHLMFCVIDGRTVDVWRVLHGKRDIPPSLQPE